MSRWATGGRKTALEVAEAEEGKAEVAALLRDFTLPLLG